MSTVNAKFTVPAGHKPGACAENTSGGRFAVRHSRGQMIMVTRLSRNTLRHLAPCSVAAVQTANAAMVVTTCSSCSGASSG